MAIWLGEKRGYLTDWLTQLWVKATGRRITLREHPWLEGPTGRTRTIGLDFFDDFAAHHGLVVRRQISNGGLLEKFPMLEGPDCQVKNVHGAVVDFYENTAEYDLDAWAEWSGVFKPFGWMLAALFSRRLQQLNVPLSALDTSRGMTSEIQQVVDPASGEIVYTAWVRQLVGTGHALYVGAYSTCNAPGHAGRCVKVAFPLPNGRAMVVMRPESHEDGSLSVVSSGKRFGDPGFYFIVEDGSGGAWVRYVRTMRETIHVYAADGGPRADHVLRIWGLTFLRLHYRMRRREKTGVRQKESVAVQA